jgi:sugar (pentulose or hexulose) kinase
MAPLRQAGETLSTVTRDVVASTGLPPDCEVVCGLHDSNAALLASRAHTEIARHDATVLSTGTWFVAMRSLVPGAAFDGRLVERRDCLINVDVHGRAVPSARFMGGRDAQILRGVDAHAPAAREAADALMRRLSGLLAEDVGAYPSVVPGVGPFPDAAGSTRNLTGDPVDRHIITGLYLAMMTDTSLGLIESTGTLLVEGPFADEAVFVRALAALRPHQHVYTCDARNDLAYGALRLAAPDLGPPAGLVRVEPLAIDIRAFADDWRRHARGAQDAAHGCPSGS